MTEDGNAPDPGIDAPEAEVVHRRGPSIVWLIPIVALIIGGGIAYRTVQSRGPVVTILFSDGAGIEAGKTKVKYRGLEAGEVMEVGIRDIETVEVKAQLGPGAAPFMTTGTSFWVVRPRVGVGGVSGLDTLVSGSYIEVLVGVDEEGVPIGDPTLEFVALEKPPLRAVYKNALTLGLETDDLRGLGEGSPVQFRDIRVGEVERFELSRDGQGVRLWLLIAEEYKHLVKPSTEFWNSSGVHLDVRASGVKVEAESLASLLAGGIDFATPPEAFIERPVGDGAIFQLNPNRTAAQEALEQGVGLILWVEARSVGSLSSGDAVFYREVRVGKVGQPRLAQDATTVRIPLLIDEKYATLVRKNSRFWNRSGFRLKAGLGGLEVQSGTVGTILEGGIAFATPDRPGEEVEAESLFELFDHPEEEWLAWNPKVEIEQLVEGEQLPHVLRRGSKRPEGLHVVLVAPRAGSFKEGSPIYYRDVKVGEVGTYRLAEDSREVHANAYIQWKYAGLVRDNTHFWNASGIGVDVGLKGVKVRTESIEAVMAGGVAFATPTKAGAKVTPGARFELHEEAKDDWLRWAPALSQRR